jgi:3',5'-cyclic AMP phosphodiesterase CpdA
MKVKRIITASYITAVVCVSLHLAAETLPPLPKGAFTYAVIPDTQSYDGEGRNTKRGRKAGLGPTRNKKFDAIIDWLLDNAKRENIVFVTHTGDITDMNNDFQWTFASNAMSRLDGKLPYSVVPGNHDMKSSGDTSLFQRYFPASRYVGKDWYASTFAGFTNSASIFVSGNNANSICLFGEGKERFVLVNLECNAPDPVLRWAAKELEQFADRHIIVATHQDLGAIESKNARRILRDTEGMSKEELIRYTPDLSMLGRMKWHKCHGRDGNSGNDIWKKFTSQLKKAFLVVSGDQGMIKITRVDEKGVHGNMVYSLMQDTGGGFIRIFRFIPSERIIRCYTVNPARNGEIVHSYGVWRDDKWFNFTLPYPETVDAYIPPSADNVECCDAVPSDDPIAMRRMEWEGMENVRDLGGLPGLGGKHVRRGRIYRSDGLNNNAHYRDKKKNVLPKSEWRGPGKTRIKPKTIEYIVETLGVKVDLDLRTAGEVFGMKGSPLGGKVKWMNVSSSEYAGIGSEKGRAAFVKDFRIFLDEENYPILFHCIAGADRTGSLACILNGLLGVEEDLLHRDWQYTWTGRKKPVKAPERRWNSLMSVFNSYEGNTLNERIERYVISCGFTQEDIERFRKLMLE